MPTSFEMFQRISSSPRFFLPLNTELTSLVILLAHLMLASVAILLSFLTSSTKSRLRYRALNLIEFSGLFSVFFGSPYFHSIRYILSHHAAIFKMVNFLSLSPFMLWLAAL